MLYFAFVLQLQKLPRLTCENILKPVGGRVLSALACLSQMLSFTLCQVDRWDRNLYKYALKISATLASKSLAEFPINIPIMFNIQPKSICFQEHTNILSYKRRHLMGVHYSGQNY